jgi:AcrR family transcriptional regulator
MVLDSTTPRDATQDRVLEAAGQVFADHGYEGATVREICQRAGVNIAAVNYYFRDKERLYIEAVKSACLCQARQFPLPEWPAGTPALVKLKDFIRTFASRMLNNDGPQWHRQLFLREIAHPASACAELVRDHIRPTAQILAGILGELLPDVPEGKRRLIGFSIVGQCIFYRLAQPIIAGLVGEQEFRTYNADLLAEHVTQFSLKGLDLEKPGRERTPGRKQSAKGSRS